MPIFKPKITTNFNFMNKLIPLNLSYNFHCLKRYVKQIPSLRFSFLLALLVTFSANAQGPGNPFVDAGPDATIDCGQGGCADLNATFLDIGETDTYMVESIPYNPPFPFDGLANSLNPNIDDAWSDVETLPFDFCFFTNIETEFQVGSNGVIRFDVDPNDTTNGWAFSEDLPNNTNPTLSEANVFTPVHDIDPSASNTEEIGYEVLGTAPNRVLVVSYFEVPMFSGTCNALLATQMVVFYETTNVIDVYIQDKPSCPSWNSGNAAIGIQNDAGTEAFVPPGRNTSDSPWDTTNEAWRFRPAGDSVVDFSWLDEGGNVVGTDPMVTVCPDNTTTYTAQAVYTNCNGDTVTVTDDVIVTVTSTFDVDLGGDQAFCDENSYDITATLTGADPADATFLWSTGENTQTITVTTSDTYSVDVTVDGCTVTESVDILFEESPIIELGDDVLTCLATPVILDASPSNVDPATVSYEWSQDGNVLPGEIASTLSVTDFGTYSVVVTNGNCTAEDSVVVGPSDDLGVELGDDQTTCFQNPIVLDATPSTGNPADATYEWSLDGTVIPGETSATLVVTEHGTYSVAVTLLGCTDVDSVNINPLNDLGVDLRDDFDTCFFNEIRLNATPSVGDRDEATYVWTFNGVIIDGETERTLIADDFGLYGVTVTIGECSDTDEVLISERDFRVTTDKDFLTCPGEVHTLTSRTSENEDNVTYQWYLNNEPIAGATNETLEISLEENTIGGQFYKVVATFGDCVAEDEVEVAFYQAAGCVITQGISPNGDGLNDRMDLAFLADRTGIANFQVFDRLGLLVYEKSNYKNHWGGQTNDNKKLPVGTYYYVITFDTEDPVFGSQTSGWVYINQEEN